MVPAIVESYPRIGELLDFMVVVKSVSRAFCMSSSSVIMRITPTKHSIAASFSLPYSKF